MTPPRVFPAVALPSGALGSGGTGDAPGARRADIVVAGLDLAGPSGEVRVYVNNPHADATTAPAAAEGYAGSIHVYGYGGPREAAATQRDVRARAPMTRYVPATEALRAAAAQGPSAAVTLVPVPHAGPATPAIDLGDVQVSVVVRE